MTPAEYEELRRKWALEVADTQTVYVEGKHYFWSLYHTPDCLHPLTRERVVGHDYTTSLRFIRVISCG